MSGWQVSQSMPPGIAAVSEAQKGLFQSESWMSILDRGLGCSSVYVSNDEQEIGAGISRFRAGPFSIGYLGFPVGGIVGAKSSPDAMIREMRDALASAGLVALRIPVSPFTNAEILDLPFEATPESAIVDLQSWSLAGIAKNRRRDVNKSLRAPLDLVDSTDPRDGDILFALYERTLERKRGSLRYTARYFSELIALSQENSNLRVLLAKIDGAIAAYTVVVRNGSTAYYLHGAFDWAMREHIPSAMLLNAAIEWAKGEGCEIFNLMSSPPGQDSLVRYKEHWGAETREHRTYTLPVKSTYPVFRVIERLYRMIR